jgi:hypothetical protein
MGLPVIVSHRNKDHGVKQKICYGTALDHATDYRGHAPHPIGYDNRVNAYAVSSDFQSGFGVYPRDVLEPFS